MRQRQWQSMRRRLGTRTDVTHMSGLGCLRPLSRLSKLTRGGIQDAREQDDFEFPTRDLGSLRIRHRR